MHRASAQHSHACCAWGVSGAFIHYDHGVGGALHLHRLGLESVYGLSLSGVSLLKFSREWDRAVVVKLGAKLGAQGCVSCKELPQLPAA